MSVKPVRAKHFECHITRPLVTTLTTSLLTQGRLLPIDGWSLSRSGLARHIARCAITRTADSGAS